LSVLKNKAISKPAIISKAGVGTLF